MLCSLFSMHILPVLGGLFRGVAGDKSCLAWFPGGGAYFTVLINVLESLNQSEILLNISTNREVIYWWMTEYLLGIDNECASERDSAVNEDTIVSGDVLCKVREELNLKILTETAFCSWFLHVSHVAMVAVNWTSDNFAVYISKLLCVVGELEDLSGTHECEVQRIKEE